MIEIFYESSNYNQSSNTGSTDNFVGEIGADMRSNDHKSYRTTTDGDAISPTFFLFIRYVGFNHSHLKPNKLHISYDIYVLFTHT